jgi:hypothetical protein
MTFKFNFAPFISSKTAEEAIKHLRPYSRIVVALAQKLLTTSKKDLLTLDDMEFIYKTDDLPFQELMADVENNIIHGIPISLSHDTTKDLIIRIFGNYPKNIKHDYFVKLQQAYDNYLTTKEIML